MRSDPAAPRALTGAVLGVLLTASLIAVLYLGRQAAGLPFVPALLFDWLARTLPGELITAAIDTMVAGLRALPIGELSEAAKTTEALLALILVVLLGGLGGAALFAVLRRRSAPRVLAGLVLGAVLGVPLMIVSLVTFRGTADPVVAGLWVLLLFLAWGAALGWSWVRLRDAFPPGEQPAHAERVDRRTFVIGLGSAAAVITVVGTGVGARLATLRERERVAARGTPWSATHPLPNAGAAVQPVPGTRPELTPVEDHYRIDINVTPPVIREEDWRLRIGGLVARPAEWTLEQLRSDYEPVHRFITLACISNPLAGTLIGTQRWTGVPLRRLLEEVGVSPGGTHLLVQAADGFDEVLTVDEVMADERIMLAYAWDGLPLTPEHGFPLRIYRPDRYGMKQPKWIRAIEVIDHEAEGYWVRRGWDEEARMNATSVIDTVGVDRPVVGADGVTRIPVGGIAHAGARGVSRVEVRVDDGPWEQAELREPLSGLTWVLWRFDWPFAPGAHTLTVRCVDGDGEVQVAAASPVRPDGATGLDTRDVTL